MNFDPNPALKAKTVREFDAAVTAPQFGFASVDEYYQSATTSGNIHKFSIPVFALSACDDPMQPGHRKSVTFFINEFISSVTNGQINHSLSPDICEKAQSLNLVQER